MMPNWKKIKDWLTKGRQVGDFMVRLKWVSGTDPQYDGTPAGNAIRRRREHDQPRHLGPELELNEDYNRQLEQIRDGIQRQLDDATGFKPNLNIGNIGNDHYEDHTKRLEQLRNDFQRRLDDAIRFKPNSKIRYEPPRIQYDPPVISRDHYEGHTEQLEQLCNDFQRRLDDAIKLKPNFNVQHEPPEPPWR